MLKRFLFLVILSFMLIPVFAQTGIGTTTPNASAKLDVFSTTKGFLPPRVALTSTSSFSPITGLSDASSLLTAAGLLIYNTATAGTAPNNVTPGFYYWNGTSWIRLIVPTDNAANVTGTVAVANGGTGLSALGSGVATFLGTPTSANLESAVTGETGSGALVFGTSPSFTTPTLGAASATSLVVPAITGGTGTTQTLTFKPTSGNGATGADHIFQVGNNGGTEAMRILNNGNIGVGNISPSVTFDVNGSVRIRTFGTYDASDSLVMTDASGNLKKRILTPVSIQPTATGYTLSPKDNGGIITFAATAAITITVPATLPAGFVCQIIQKGTGQITITGSGITLNSANGFKSRARYSAIGVVMESSTIGYVTGDTSL